MRCVSYPSTFSLSLIIHFFIYIAAKAALKKVVGDAVYGKIVDEMFCQNIVKKTVNGLTGGFIANACREVQKILRDVDPTFKGFQTFGAAKVI